MRLRFSVLVLTVVTMFVGLVTLLGLLVGDDLGFLSVIVTAFPIRILALLFIQLATITIAVTIILGVGNLLFVHVTRALRSPGGRLNSIILLVAFFGTIFAYIASPETSDILLNDVLIAGESTLASLLFFTLVLGAMQILKHKISWSRILFVISMVLVLLAAVPLDVLAPVRNASDWLVSIPVNAGGRGILLGIALATLVTGLRVLIGQDRSYGE